MTITTCATLETPVPMSTYHDKEGIPFQVRDFAPTDRQELQEFYEAFVPKRAAQGLPPSTPDRIHAWLKTVLASGLHILAFRNDELIGHAMVMDTERPGIGEYAVFLRLDARGRGVGTELNRVVAERAKAAGRRGLWLTVEPRNRAAVRSYEKVGFRFDPHSIYSLEAEMELFF
jgi:L-amino acid N-acyltransferase